MIRTLKHCALLVAVAVIAGVRPSSAQNAADAAYKAANDLMVNEQWSEAQAAFARFSANYSDHDLADDAAFWACFSQQQRAAVSEATYRCYESFVEDYRRSRYADDARSKMITVAQGLARAGNREYEAVVQSLRENDDREVAMAALYALGDMGDAEAVATLQRLYDSATDPGMRRRIVHVLGDAETPEVFARLKSIALNDPSADVAKAAVYALGDFDDEAAASAALAEILASGAPVEVRKAAVYGMSDLEGDAAAESLSRLALGADEPELAKAATYALGDVEGPQVASRLMNILRNAQSVEVRKAALYALSDHDAQDVVPLLTSVATDMQEPELQKAAVYALADVESAGVAAALRSIYASAATTEVRKAVLYAMGDVAENDGASAVQFLSDVAMSNEDPDVAKAAVYALEDHATDNDLLVNILRNAPLMEVRKAVLYQLADDGSANAAAMLVSVLRDDESAELRKAAAYSLGDSGTDEAIPVLKTAAMSDPSREVRKAAVRALGEIGSPAAQEALLEILGGGN